MPGTGAAVPYPRLSRSAVACRRFRHRSPPVVAPAARRTCSRWPTGACSTAGPLLLAGDPRTRGAAVATPVVTDTCAVARWASARCARRHVGESLTSDEAYRLDRPGTRLPPGWPGDRRAQPACHGGLSAVHRLLSGSDVDALLARGPAASVRLPAGDTSTSLVSGSFKGAVGQSLDVRFTQPGVFVRGRARLHRGAVRRTAADQARAGDGRRPPRGDGDPGPLVAVATASGATARLRITVAAVEGGGGGFATGLATLVVPQLFPTRTLVVPPPTSGEPPLVAFGVADGAHQSCVGTGGVPACAPSAERAGEEDVALDRSFSTDGTDDLRLALTVRPRPGAALDALLAPPGGSLRARDDAARHRSQGRPRCLRRRRPGHRLGGGTRPASPVLR